MSEAPRLFLITPPLVEAAAFAPHLEAALAAADIACVLLRTVDGDESRAKSVFRALAPIVQRRDAACLVADDARRAARVDADGVHVTGVGPRLDDALESLRARKIVGVGGLRTRDEAMTAGEAGVDYLMFGGPDEDHDQDAVLERVAWWAEIFNVPCVGYATAPEHTGDVARAGAEFVALCDGLWDRPERIADTLAAVVGAMRLAEEAAP